MSVGIVNFDDFLNLQLLPKDALLLRLFLLLLLLLFLLLLVWPARQRTIDCRHSRSCRCSAMCTLRRKCNFPSSSCETGKKNPSHCHAAAWPISSACAGSRRTRSRRTRFGRSRRRTAAHTPDQRRSARLLMPDTVQNTHRPCHLAPNTAPAYDFADTFHVP